MTTKKKQTSKQGARVMLVEITYHGRPMKFATRVGTYNRANNDIQIQFTDETGRIHGEWWGNNIYAPAFPSGTVGAVKINDKWYWVVLTPPRPVANKRGRK